MNRETILNLVKEYYKEVIIDSDDSTSYTNLKIII